MRTIAGHQRKTAAQRARLKPRQMTPPASRLMASGEFPMKPVRNCFSTRFQGTPEAVRVGGIVSAMDAVLAEGNSARYLRGQLGDFDRDLQMVQVPNDKRVELGNGARLHRDASLQPVTGDDLDEMLV